MNVTVNCKSCAFFSVMYFLFQIYLEITYDNIYKKDTFTTFRSFNGSFSIMPLSQSSQCDMKNGTVEINKKRERL